MSGPSVARDVAHRGVDVAREHDADLGLRGVELDGQAGRAGEGLADRRDPAADLLDQAERASGRH